MSFSPSTAEERHLLRLACRLWNLQPGFGYPGCEPNLASPETLVVLLQAISGLPIEGSKDLQDAIHAARAMHLTRTLAPVHVVWDGAGERGFVMNLPEAQVREPLRVVIQTEDGNTIEEDVRILQVERTFRFDGKAYARVRVPFPKSSGARQLPYGYHTLAVEHGGLASTARLMCAPVRVGSSRKATPNRRWGLFAPLYGVRRGNDWGIGDLTALEAAQEFTAAQGGSFFGTLPLLPSFCEGTECDPSPYSSVSRLFWNEAYLNIEKLAELDASPSSTIRRKLESTELRSELERLRRSEYVDYDRVFTMKREFLRELARDFFANGGEQSREYQEFLRAKPEVERYAKFRARDNDTERRLHLYAQFRLDQEFARLSERAKKGEIAGLYLDFPVGVSRGSFDAEEFAPSFLHEANAGAPPDLLFMGGQEWGFAPLHPIRARETGYAYFIKCIRHHMQYASVLRLDHIMAFHRIYAIPRGMPPKAGAYIRYRAEEFYALLSLEAQRAGVRVVGEDLGTVPEPVREALNRHDCLRMWVLPFESGREPQQALSRSPAKSLACLNTHDMVPFAGYRSGRDLEIFAGLGFLDHETENREKHERRNTIASWMQNVECPDEAKLAAELLKRMAAASPELCLINIEDLWGEREPQNVPGTWKEMPNWRRKLRLALEEWEKEPGLTELLAQISNARRDERGEQSGNTSGSRDGSKQFSGGPLMDASDNPHP